MADSTPAEEVQVFLVVPRDMAEKGAKDFFREEWVEELGIMTLTEALEEGVVLMGLEGVVEGEEGTLVEAVEMVPMIPVGEVEGLIMLEQISKMNAVIKQPVMVR